MLMSLEMFHERKGSRTRELNLQEKMLRVDMAVAPNRENDFKEGNMA